MGKYVGYEKRFVFAAMKLKHLILFLAMFLAACSSRHPDPVETRFVASDLIETRLIASDLIETRLIASLQAIDSLMWRQPDSALMVLIDFAGGPQADSLSAFDGHYCQLLLSELLYKNDYAQTNREELLKAVDYFDSIVMSDGRDADGRDAINRVSTDIVFLDARAHYIKGVGFYENDSVVEACAEYLKAVEVMEEQFEEKNLVKDKAKFMTYTYNRLMELFSSQFMMESAIVCGEQTMNYCLLEPTSPSSISNILNWLGIQYYMMDSLYTASLYFGRALEIIPDTNNLTYRNVVASKALCDYQLGLEPERLLSVLRTVLMKAEDESERITRYLTIGGIFFEEKMFDSALQYLEPVFEQSEDNVSRIQAAEYLRVIYDSLGNEFSSEECTRFLARQKKSEGENKALVSQLDNLFQNHVKRKLGKLSEAEHTKHIKKIVGTIVPIVVLLVLAIIIVAKLRSKKLLKQQQEEADRVLGETEQAHDEKLRRLQTETHQRLEEAERKHRQKVEEMVKRHEDELRIQRDLSEKELEQTKQRHEAELEAERLAYETEQDALRQSLRQQEDQMKVTGKSLCQQQDKAEVWHKEFLKEPICKRINELLHGKRITTRDTSFKHNDITLKEDDYKQLREAVERHFEGFDAFLLSRCPSLKQGDLALCHLHLMGLSEGEIAALKSRTYSGIKKQDESIKEKLLIDENVSEYVLRISEKSVNRSEDIFKGSITNETHGFSQKSSQKNSQKIVELIRKRPGITTSEMAETIGVSRRTIVNITNKLREEGAIRRVGPDKGGHWEVMC